VTTARLFTRPTTFETNLMWETESSVPDRLSIHEPVLVNTIGHCAGAIIFGILLYLFVVNGRRMREESSSLPAVAAALAMLWNVGSLVALASAPNSGFATDLIIAASFSVLSLLPAVLLQISLGAAHRALWISGYVLSIAAVTLHVADLLTQARRLHYAALLLVTFGFGGLTIISALLQMRQNRAAVSRLAGAMGLFLFAISFVHFGSEHPRQIWEGEIALHHAGLPLALLVLLQGYRFLLLDTFLRFVLNASLGAGALLLSIRIIQSRDLTPYLHRPFDAGILFVAACLLLVGFVYLRNRMQKLLTKVIFLRSNLEESINELHDVARATTSEPDYLNYAAEVIVRFFGTERFALSGDPPLKIGELEAPVAVMDIANWNVAPWVQAVVPLVFSRGDAKYLLLGPRKGGRRYLSEDYSALERQRSVVIQHVEQARSAQMQNLVSQAELRALQAQINPHFLFNCLNTLYGTIGRENFEARRLVLNLADVFRYFLQADRPFIQVDEELRIVRAYLEIEELRLGPKLRSELEIDDKALKEFIPVLSIQPLIENAVKHGVAAKPGQGFVRLRIKSASGRIAVSVSNSGECDQHALTNSPSGVGLSNVRRRLTLCYGEDARIEVTVKNGITTVGFGLPLKQSRVVSMSA
jgi:two-component system LytT family sensor kinase